METSVRYPPSLYVKYRPSTVYLCHVDHPYLPEGEVGLLHEDFRELLLLLPDHHAKVAHLELSERHLDLNAHTVDPVSCKLGAS